MKREWVKPPARRLLESLVLHVHCTCTYVYVPGVVCCRRVPVAQEGVVQPVRHHTLGIHQGPYGLQDSLVHSVMSSHTTLA